MDQTQKGQHIFDFAGVVEAHAAHQAVRRAGAHERVLNGAGLRVGAVQNAEIVQRYALGLVQALNLAQHVQRFILLVVRLVHGDGRASVVVRPEALLFAQLVCRDDRARDLQNGAGRAVVLLQDDDFQIRKVVLEMQNIANIGASPGINGLVFVADDAQVAAFFGE